MTPAEGSLAAWYRADQEAARVAYAAADSATLASLLTVLDQDIATSRDAAETWQRSLAEGRGVEAELEEQRNDVFAAVRSRAATDPAWHEVAEEVSRTLGSAVDALREGSRGNPQRLVDIALVQGFALAGRRNLIREELQRRDLLPHLPT